MSALEKGQTNNKFLTVNDKKKYREKERRFLSIHTMVNSENSSTIVECFTSVDTDPCCCRDIRDLFDHEKTRYRRADSTDSDYERAALFSRSSLSLSLSLRIYERTASRFGV